MSKADLNTEKKEEKDEAEASKQCFNGTCAIMNHLRRENVSKESRKKIDDNRQAVAQSRKEKMTQNEEATAEAPE